MEILQIAIDGPAGAGKSTVAKLVAEKMGLVYIDTGAMYRALTWKALKLNIALENQTALSNLAIVTQISLNRKDDGTLKVLCDGADVTTEIRLPEVSEAVSKVSGIPGVRAQMLVQQQQLAASTGVVMDGRDIGTHVLPLSRHKFFLSAPLEIRARRRWIELRDQGQIVDFAELTHKMAERDKLDESRAEAPLTVAPDAVYIDSDGMSIEQVANKIIEICTAKTH